MYFVPSAFIQVDVRIPSRINVLTVMRGKNRT